MGVFILEESTVLQLYFQDLWWDGPIRLTRSALCFSLLCTMFVSVAEV